MSSLVIRRQIRLHVRRRLGRSSSNGEGRVPRVARLLALAIHYSRLLEAGAVRDYAELARLGKVSPARLSQIMNLRLLAPDIQEEILFLPETAANRDILSERDVRPIALEPDWKIQRQMWAALEARLKSSSATDKSIGD